MIKRILVFVFLIFSLTILADYSPVAYAACAGQTTYTQTKNGQYCNCPDHAGRIAVEGGRNWRCVYQSGAVANTSYWQDLSGDSTSSTSVPGCQQPFDIPVGCEEDYVPNFECINRKIIEPAYACCRNVCRKDARDIPIEDQPAVFQQLFSFFGRTIAITSGNQLVAIFNVGITTVLGLFTVFAMVFGVYIAGVVRARTTDQAEIENSNKTLINIIIGFALAWSFLFIIQIVMGFLGLGNLSNLVFLDAKPSDPNVIVIQ